MKKCKNISLNRLSNDIYINTVYIYPYILRKIKTTSSDLEGSWHDLFHQVYGNSLYRYTYWDSDSTDVSKILLSTSSMV